MELNQRIFDLLEEQGKKATSLAEYIGISAPSVSAWKNENSYPSSKYILGIANFFNVSVSYLITGEEESTKASNLSGEEQELLKMYRELDEDGQSKVLGCATKEKVRIKRELLAKTEFSEEIRPKHA